MKAATLHRLMLAGEVLFYLLIGFVTVTRLGWLPRQAVGLAMVLAVLGRAVIIATTFLFSRLYAAAPPPGCAIGVGRGIAMALRELAAFTVLFSAVMPFEGLLMRGDRLGRREDGRPPLLLVHGYQCNRGFWIWLRRRMEQAGWQAATISLAPVFGDIDGYVEQLERRIDEVCQAAGSERLVLVGHSMGGLVSRAYLRARGSGKVARLVTLGSPHHGSRLALLGMGENARQMIPESGWLAGLNAPGAAPLPAAAASIYSCQDNYVMPQDSPRLDGAREVPLPSIGHLEMAFSPEIARRLLEELERA
ncbi:MAG TPA: alpha/beta fold hydrolase [Candidatus Desulfobacillus sp.]|nr:alpha/beta fold hydrolase [Candidatus Desulfobacillus sp.]